MRTADFDFDLPDELIAQQPLPNRDESRLLVLDRRTGTIEHRSFVELAQLLRPGDLVVANNSRVIPARLRAVNAHTGGQFEVLLLEENARNDWWAMLKPGKRARMGTRLLVARGPDAVGIEATVIETNAEGHRRLLFRAESNILDVLDTLGEVPLPPYIRREHGPLAGDRERYQTVYAATPGSVAAPTAGLHFTETLMQSLKQRGVEVAYLTLHVGVGTFAPVKSETLAGHKMHEERYEVPQTTAEAIWRAKSDRRRVVAVGTTSVRVLESLAATHDGRIVPGSGRTSIFIYPPYEFRVVDALLTNFHLPRSTLLMLVSAFAAPGTVDGVALMKRVYAEAVRQKYRFFSYGDAMLLL